jgi:SAM-dependent methyltransferase
LSDVDPAIGSDHCRITVPGEASGLAARFAFQQHLFAYAEVARRVEAGSDVLEVGCGAGYGADLLSRSVEIVATDGSSKAVAYASARYPAVRFQPADATCLPFRTGCFDVVASFQVIEHVVDDAAFVGELWRVLKPGGTLFVTTPNRRIRLLPFQRPWNPYHAREYSDRTLLSLIRTRFPGARVEGVMCRPDLMRIERRRVRPDRMALEAVGRRVGLRRRDGASAQDEVPVGPDDFFLAPDAKHCIDLFCTAAKRPTS